MGTRVPIGMVLGLSQGVDDLRMPNPGLQQHIEEAQRGLDPVVKRLEHVGFSGETDGVVQGRIPGRKPGRFEEVLDPVIRCGAQAVDVGTHLRSPFFHAGIQLGQQGRLKPSTQRSPEFVGLGGNEGHGGLVVGTIGGVGVGEEVRVEIGEHGVERQGVPAVALDEVPVEVQVPCIASEPVFLRAVLVGAGAAIAPQPPSYIVERDDADVDALGQTAGLE